tara:strand:+ start:159 stop:578 length:420 start_codon:yes stop_codon:yes gene_type:complete
MRVEKWETKLNILIQEVISRKKFIRGKNDCGSFVVESINTITDKNIILYKYKTLKEFKKLLKENKKKTLLDLILNIAKTNNFKSIDISRTQRGDVVYFVDETDLDGTVGICIGSNSMFNWKNGVNLINTFKCKYAWRIQ